MGSQRIAFGRAGAAAAAFKRSVSVLEIGGCVTTVGAVFVPQSRRTSVSKVSREALPTRRGLLAATAELASVSTSIVLVTRTPLQSTDD
ncbi:hypothetical protein B586_12425 [Mycobacterium haemophilum DSM 44634]|nr:hypothetical protein B586_12425 [Mycobacterium haemophilum DSM 44634]